MGEPADKREAKKIGEQLQAGASTTPAATGTRSGDGDSSASATTSCLGADYEVPKKQTHENLSAQPDAAGTIAGQTGQGQDADKVAVQAGGRVRAVRKKTPSVPLQIPGAGKTGRGGSGRGSAPTRPAKKQRMSDEEELEYRREQANKAIHASVGVKVPTLADYQLLAPAAPLPQAANQHGQDQAQAANQLHGGALGAVPVVPANQPQAANQHGGALGAVPVVPANQPQAANQHGGAPGAVLPVVPANQPQATCPHCRIGRGTVTRRHLCCCLRCPDSPLHDQCPFCALAAVPKLEPWAAGMCPCCGARPGIAAPDHLCRCRVCRQVPDAVCRHCALAAVPQPRPRADGACPCCLTRAGTVATHHLCLCLECQALPAARCKFCDLEAGQGAGV